jgi:FKBP-type peptidyl-prolyl cis-trans isomerase SlpA
MWLAGIQSGRVGHHPWRYPDAHRPISPTPRASTGASASIGVPLSLTVAPDSLVTLHYRFSLPNGQPLISTFESTPATLQLGAGEMLPGMERLIVGLEIGSHHVFDLAAADAFGPRRPDLVERVRREHMPAKEIEPMSIMEFVAPDGSRYSGLVREIDQHSALVDFNHPLAGKDIRLEVDIIGIV